MANGRVVGVWAYPWDVAQWGVSQTVDRLQEAGIGEVSLATVYHSGQVLSLAGKTPRLMMEPQGPLVDVRRHDWQQGDLTFHPDVLLDELAPALRDAGIRLRGWTIVNHDKAHWLPTVNVWGQAMPHAACPLANRQAIGDLVKELSRSGHFDALDLESMGYTSAFHGAHHEIAGVVVTPLLQWLLSLCFCPACETYFAPLMDWPVFRDVVQRSTQRLLQAEGPRDPMAQLAGFLGEHAWASAFVALRGRMLDDLLTELAEASAIPLAPILMAYGRRAQLAWIEGLMGNPAVPSDLIVLGYGEAPMIREDLEWLWDKGWTPNRLMVGQSLLPSVAATQGDAEARVQAALTAGAERWTFYNLGLLTDTRWGWLKQLTATIMASPPVGR